MPPDEIQCTRLRLLRITTEQLKSIAAGALLESLILEPDWLEDLADLKESVEHCHESDWWRPYLVCLPDELRAIGVVLFKGPPDLSGTIEIAYSIAPGWRGQGHGREVVRAILNAVREISGIDRVCAHTLPEMNASSRVLAHCGFEKVRVIQDVDLGPVWRWETSSLCVGPEK